MIAKELDAPYRPGDRKGMAKIKRLRTIDAVVAGWRPGKEENTVGSLMLGLYDGDDLRVVGHTSGPQGRREAGAGQDARSLRERRARLRRPEPLDCRPRPRVGLPAARAGDRGDLRPRQRRPDPPRREDPALARGQGAGGLHDRPAGQLGHGRADHADLRGRRADRPDHAQPAGARQRDHARDAARARGLRGAREPRPGDPRDRPGRQRHRLLRRL